LRGLIIAPADANCKRLLDRQGRFGLWNIRYHLRVTSIVRPDQRDHDDLEALRLRLVELEATLDERGAEASRMKSDVDLFRISYRQQVGTLHEQLDKLELSIAEAELGELSKLVENEAESPRESPPSAGPTLAPRFTSDAVRRLFRDVAKAIHPDLAGDELARDRRHSLMVEANRAYALGDAEQLRWILQAWERSPEAVQGSEPDALRLRLVRRVAQIEEQLEMLAAELADLQASPLWKLKAMVDEAAAKGKDLVREMVVRLQRDIMVASNRLDAMRPPR
jgi:hypothetical protein